MEMVEIPVWALNTLSAFAGLGLALGPVNFWVVWKNTKI